MGIESFSFKCVRVCVYVCVCVCVSEGGGLKPNENLITSPVSGGGGPAGGGVDAKFKSFRTSDARIFILVYLQHNVL